VGKARIAFRFGHYGDCFHGSQVQPDVPTVQGAFMHVFKKKLKWTNERIPVAMASRTDSGVHVRLNGGYIDIDENRWNAMGESGFIKAVGHQIPDSIALIDARRVADDWSPRRALRRTYRYRMECMEGWVEPSLDDFINWCALFEGEHDWANFCRREPGRTTQRVVESCRPWTSEGRIVGFEIIGEAFVWNQVRRIANALLAICNGYHSVERVLEARDTPGVEIDLGLSEPDWLILWSVEWDDILDIESEDAIIPLPDHSSRRWQDLCRQQQKEILIRQFDLIEGKY
jgi:tRNA pseudouridine38-40 synthase